MRYERSGLNLIRPVRCPPIYSVRLHFYLLQVFSSASTLEGSVSGVQENLMAATRAFCMG